MLKQYEQGEAETALLVAPIESLSIAIKLVLLVSNVQITATT